jgi:hypothetical protein
MSTYPEHPNVGEILEAIAAQIKSHDDHTWTQIGRCVYCSDCNQRLYQGTIPATHTKVKALSRWVEASDPSATRKMRERWGKS